MDLLIFFALPIATIIIAAILQKILKSPIAVAALIFAIYLIVTFAAFDETFLIATLAYTILAFITAVIICFLCKDKENDEENNTCGCNNNILSDLTNNTSNNNSTCGCRYNRYRRF